MKESYSEVLARHAGPESYAGGGNTVGVATAGVHAGAVLSSVNRFISCADVVQTAEGNIASSANGKHEVSTAESKTWCMCGNSKRENREIPSAPWRRRPGRPANLTEGTAGMYADGKSDDFIVPAKRANKTGTPAAEFVEGRRSPKRSHVRYVVAPDTEPESAILKAGEHARHVAMSPSRPSSLNGGAV